MDFPPVFGWMRELSRHYFAGFRALADVWPAPVTVVAQMGISPERAAFGWTPPPPGRVRVLIAADWPDPAAELDALWRAHGDAIHVVQSTRGDGVVGDFWRRLAARRSTGGTRAAFVAERISTVGGWRRNLVREIYYRFHTPMRLARLARAYFGVGAMGREYFLRRAFPADRIHPYTYALDDYPSAPPPCPPPRSPGAPLRLLFVGRGAPEKRADLIARALRALPRDAWTLTVVGPRPEDVGYPFFRALGGAGDVRLEPPASSAALAAHYAAHDLLLLPSDWDGWGMVVTEAMAHGCPAVVSDRVGARELVRAHNAGAIFRVGRAAGLIAALRGVLDDPARLDLWKAGARAAYPALAPDLAGRYFADLLTHCFVDRAAPRPSPPWLAGAEA